MALTGKDGKLLLRDGGLAIGQECCCGCACSNVQLSKTIHVTVTITIPESNVDCPAGPHTVEFDLTWDFLFGRYRATHSIPLGDDLNGCVIVDLACENGTYFSFVIFSTYPCGEANYVCTIGNGGFVGFGTDAIQHEMFSEGGVCYPRGASGDYTETEYTGARAEWTIEDPV